VNEALRITGTKAKRRKVTRARTMWIRAYRISNSESAARFLDLASTLDSSLGNKPTE
jgi:hypothetical protein